MNNCIKNILGHKLKIHLTKPSPTKDLIRLIDARVAKYPELEQQIKDLVIKYMVQYNINDFNLIDYLFSHNYIPNKFLIYEIILNDNTKILKILLDKLNRLKQNIINMDLLINLLKNNYVSDKTLIILKKKLKIENIIVDNCRYRKKLIRIFNNQENLEN